MPFTALNQTFSPWEPGLLSLFLYAVLVISLVAVLLFLCARLGETNKTLEKSRPYECGIIPSDSARFRYPVPFYLMAIFFLVFDVEAAFIFAWAVAFDQLGWTGWFGISFFIFVLLFSLFYIWRKGGLDWRTKS